MSMDTTTIPQSSKVDDVTIEKNASDELQVKNTAMLVPIGSVLPWLKSYTNTPALTSGWVECNGQVLDDAGSVFHGQTIPNLNIVKSFLRGSSTSGTIAGDDTHSHQWKRTEVTSNGRAIMVEGADSNDAAGGWDANGTAQDWLGAGATPTQLQVGNGDYTAKTSTLPKHYEVVYIMRVK